MTTKIFIIAILIVIAMANTFSTCKKGGPGCVHPVYYFKTGVQAYPDQDSIRIGDTIWITAHFSKKLIETNSHDTVEFSGATNLGSDLSFDIFRGGSISDPGTNYAANDFNYSLVIGSPANNPFTDRIKEYLFKENDNTYDFKLGIIPKFSGTYAVAIGDAQGVARKSDKCSKAYFEIDFENTNQHLYLYQDNRPGYTISEYEQKHMYCFRVY